MDKYSVTIRIAERGTPLDDGNTSQTGHMWYELSNGVDPKVQSFGFAPDADHSGAPFAPGAVQVNDNTHYTTAVYSRTLEITQEQYQAMLDFGGSPETFGFDTQYNGLTNSCIDFTWKALELGGLNPTGFDGDVWPTHNIDDVAAIGTQNQTFLGLVQGLQDDLSASFFKGISQGAFGLLEFDFVDVRETGAETGVDDSGDEGSAQFASYDEPDTGQASLPELSDLQAELEAHLASLDEYASLVQEWEFLQGELSSNPNDGGLLNDADAQANLADAHATATAAMDAALDADVASGLADHVAASHAEQMAALEAQIAEQEAQLEAQSEQLSGAVGGTLGRILGTHLGGDSHIEQLSGQLVGQFAGPEPGFDGGFPDKRLVDITFIGTPDDLPPFLFELHHEPRIQPRQHL